MDINRLKQLPFRLFSPKNAYNYLLESIPWMTNVESSWRLSGATLLSFEPSAFINNLRVELSSFPFSVCSEIWDIVKEKVAADALIVVADSLQPPIDPVVASKWASASKSSYPEPQNLFGLLGTPLQSGHAVGGTPATQTHFASGFAGYPPHKKFAFSPPSHVSSQYGLAQPAPLPSQYGQKAPLAHESSLNGLMAPSVANAFNSPSNVNAQQLSQNSQMAPPVANAFNSLPNVSGPQPLQHGQQASLHSPQSRGGPQFQLQPPPLSQNHVQQFNSFLPFSVHAPAKVLKPWELAALSRAPALQDPGMPTGYKRISMHAVIEAAKAERLAQGAPQTVVDKVVWPVMDKFDADSYRAIRLKYYESML